MLKQLVIWFYNLFTKSGYNRKLLNEINKVGIRNHLIQGYEYRHLLDSAEPSDLILTRPLLEATNLLQGISDPYTHAAAYINVPDKIADSTGRNGVFLRDNMELLIGTHKICLLSLNLPDDLKMAINHTLINLTSQNIKYDYCFDIQKDEMYCSEYYYHAVNHVVPDYLPLFDIYGLRGITPHHLRGLVDYDLFTVKMEIIK